MTMKEKQTELTAAPGPVAEHPRPNVVRWRNADERAAALRAKKQRRRAAHRIALRRSHAKG